MTTAITCRHHWWVEPSDVRIGNTTLKALCLRCWRWRTFPKFGDRDWGGRGAAWRHLKEEGEQ